MAKLHDCRVSHTANFRKITHITYAACVETSIRMNKWVIFFHFEMIGIKFALKLSQMCGI